MSLYKINNFKNFTELNLSWFIIIMTTVMITCNTEYDQNINFAILKSSSVALAILNSLKFLDNYKHIKVTILIILCINFKYIFFLAAILGIPIFIYNLFVNRQYWYKPLICGGFYTIFIGCHIICNYQSDFLYKNTLDTDIGLHDLFFHSTISSSLRDINLTSTRIHETPSWSYWDYSNEIVANLADYLNIRPFDFYNLIYPFIVWSLMLYFFNSLSKGLNKILINCNLVNCFILNIVMCLLTSMLCFSPYWGPLQNFFKWTAPLVISVPVCLTIVSLFILTIIETFKIKNLFSKSFFQYVIFIFFTYFICKTKFHVSHFILILMFISLFFPNIKNNFIRPRFLFLIVLAIYSHHHFNFNTTTTSLFSLSPFYLWLRCIPSSLWIWAPFILSLPLVVIIASFYKHGNLNQISFNGITQNTNFFWIIIFSSFYIFCILLTIPFGEVFSWALLYYLDTFYIITVIPLSFFITNYISNSIKNILSFKNISLYIILSLIFIQYFSIGLNRWVSIGFSSGDIKSRFSSDSNPKNSSLTLCETLKEISKFKKTNSVLWIPKYNQTAWESLEFEYEFARPFFFSALSDLPQLFGFSGLPPANIKGSFGFACYESFPTNAESDLDFAKNEARRLRYDKLIVLESDKNYRVFNL